MSRAGLFLLFLQMRQFLARSSSIEEYQINCIVISGENRSIHECNLALFSLHKSFVIIGTLSVLSTDLCSNSTDQVKKSTIALVRRGNCTFEAKSRQATEQGYRALIIMNSENAVFPPGGGLSNSSSIPTMMISASFWDFYTSLCSNEMLCPHVSVELKYSK
jgi:hypothetical protein